MRYSASESEQAALREMSLEERFHYAVGRIVETEEIWSLGDENGWQILDRGDTQIIPVWPYRHHAVESMEVDFPATRPISVSLEHFMYGLLKQCIDNKIMLDINPAPGATGFEINAAQLYEVLESMVESGSYFVEG